MPTIHPTAMVSPDAEIPDDVTIGPCCVIDEDVRIGPGCRLIGHVYLHGKVTLGRDNTIYPFACIGFDPQDFKFDGKSGGVVIGDRNVIRESAVIHMATHHQHPTRVGDDNYLMTNSHVGHDVTVGNHCTIISGALLAGHMIVEDRVTVGANAFVHQHCRIGRFSFLGGCCVITKDIPPFMLCHKHDEVLGLNVVGLRRNKIDRPAIDALRQAFRTLYLSNHGNPIATEQIQHQADRGGPGSELLTELAHFIRNSKRGLCSFQGRNLKKISGS